MLFFKELGKRFDELEESFEKIDQDRTIRNAWARLAQLASVDLELIPSETTFGFLDRLGRRLEERLKAEEQPDRSEMVLHLIHAFLNGPIQIVLHDTETEVAQGVVIHKIKEKSELLVEDIQALKHGIDNLHDSALYPLSYKFIYHHFDQLAEGLHLDPPDHLTVYPPTEALIQLTESIDQLYLELTGVSNLIDQVLWDPTMLNDPQTQSRIETMIEASGPYEKYRAKTRDLIKMVLGSAATGFLEVSIKSTSSVDRYLLQGVTDGGLAPESQYIKLLKEAPAYLRAIIYVSEANNPGHAITGAHIPFSVEVSSYTAKWLDDMLSSLLGGKADAHPFFSSQRESLHARDPLNVAQEYLHNTVGS